MSRYDRPRGQIVSGKYVGSSPAPRNQPQLSGQATSIYKVYVFGMLSNAVSQNSVGSLSVGKVRVNRLDEWAEIRSKGLARYLVLHGALPWGLLPGFFSFLAISVLFKFKVFSLNGLFRLLSCLLSFSYCGVYFAWHRWQTEKAIWESRIDTMGENSSDE